MIRAFLFYFCVIVVQYVTAQNPSLPGELSLGLDVFDDAVIAQKKIKTIHAEYSYKYDLQTIRDDKKEITYYFNNSGKISRKIEQRHYHNREDSIIFEFYYDKQGQVSTYVKTESKNHTVMLLDIGDTHYKVSLYLIPKALKWNEHVNAEYMIWSDSVFNKDFKKQYYNQHDVHYKNLTHYRDPVTKSESLSFYSKDGRLQRKVSYNFEENGDLKSIEEKNTNPYLFNWKKTFEYDEGVFVEERYYKEGVQQHLRKITYHENGLPELDIQRNDISKKMTIIQYEY